MVCLSVCPFLVSPMSISVLICLCSGRRPRISELNLQQQQQWCLSRRAGRSNSGDLLIAKQVQANRNGSLSQVIGLKIRTCRVSCWFCCFCCCCSVACDLCDPHLTSSQIGLSCSLVFALLTPPTLSNWPAPDLEGGSLGQSPTSIVTPPQPPLVVWLSGLEWLTSRKFNSHFKSQAIGKICLYLINESEQQDELVLLVCRLVSKYIPSLCLASLSSASTTTGSRTREWRMQKPLCFG